MTDKVFVYKAEYKNLVQIINAVESVFACLPSAEKLNADSKVLIKPNLLAAHAPEKAVTTDPMVVEAVIIALKKRGVRDILVADSPGGGATEQKNINVYKVCGITQVCEKYGAKTYIASESATVASKGVFVKNISLINPVLERDYIINVAKLKSHGLTGMTAAVKNLFGCVPGLEKAEFHMRFPKKELFVEMLLDVCLTVNADMHIVDAVLSMEKDGPGSGVPKQTDRIFAGENPYLMDLALCWHIGLSPEKAPLLAAAASRGLCQGVFDTAVLVGEEELKKPFADFELPATYAQTFDFSEELPKILRPLAAFMAKNIAPKPVVNKKECIGCGKCAEICPQKIIEMHGKKAKIYYKECIRCFCCHEICPAHAIYLKRTKLFKLGQKEKNGKSG